MKQEKLNNFREKLIALQSELKQLNDINDEAGEVVALDQAKVGRLSRIDAMQAQQIARETARRRQVQQQKIIAALRRIEAGEYGYCVICGEDIEQGRLDFDPASTRCMACMSQ